MITTDTIGRFSIPLLIGAEDALGAGQMSVFLCDARDDPIREQYYLRTLLGRRVDGIIVTGRRTQARPPIGADLPVPVVYAFISSTDPEDCSVVPDEAGGARQGDRAPARHRPAPDRPHHRPGAPPLGAGPGRRRRGPPAPRPAWSWWRRRCSASGARRGAGRR